MNYRIYIPHVKPEGQDPISRILRRLLMYREYGALSGTKMGSYSTSR